jgi:hypothetical protein
MLNKRRMGLANLFYGNGHHFLRNAEQQNLSAPSLPASPSLLIYYLLLSF